MQVVVSSNVLKSLISSALEISEAGSDISSLTEIVCDADQGQG